jgi:hypothetical protein
MEAQPSPAERYRQEAARIRSEAARARDATVRDALLEIARQYEELAVAAEKPATTRLR